MCGRVRTRRDLATNCNDAWTGLQTSQSAGEIRADVDADAIADQLISMASYAALIGQPLSAERVEETVTRLLRGIAQ